MIRGKLNRNCVKQDVKQTYAYHTVINGLVVRLG